MLWTNENKIEVCEIYEDAIVSGPGVLDYPRGGYLLPVEYKYDEIDPTVHEYDVVTPEILPDRVLFHFKAKPLPAAQQVENLIASTKVLISEKRKAEMVAPITLAGVDEEIPGDLDTQYDVVRMYDEGKASEETEFVIKTLSGHAVITKEQLTEAAKIFTCRLQESFAKQKLLEEKLVVLNTPAKIKKFREKELS